MSSAPIRLIAADIDGTLIDNQDRIPERNLQAIRKAQEKGIVFAVASGRFPENVYVLMRKYGIACPIIALNGARTVDENLRVLSHHPMEPAAAAQVLDHLLALGSDYFFFTPRVVCTSGEKVFHHSELSDGDAIRALGHLYLRGAENAKAAVRETVYKFYVLNNIPLETVSESLRAIPDVYLTRSSQYNIEVMPLGVDKSRGVKDLAASLGIPMEQVMTLGDEDNDVPMLRAAGWGVAMGNACRAARDAARFVTDTNVNCGFAQAVEQFALQGESMP